MPVINSIAADAEQMKTWRRHLHAHPELLFDCVKTAAFVVERLREFGISEIHEGIAQTGVVAIIDGRAPGRTIGLRADMDALPMNDLSGADHASTVPGMSHACGHDGHTVMLLGAAKYLAETRNFDGSVVVIFQPAEEGGGGGREMCEDGMMDRWNIQEVYGMHNMPNLPIGHFAIRSGPFFAATDQFDIHLEGKGGHAARPQETVDTTVMAAQLVLSLQTIVSRNADPVSQIVVSVTSFETSSTAFNVIPQKVHIKGTVRTQSNDNRDLAERRIKDIAAATAAMFGGTAEVDYHRGYPVMVNSEEQTEFARDVARNVGGNVIEAPLVMGGEDFAFMLEERPGAYILVGNGPSAQVHHPEYNFNDEAIPVGCSWWAEIVERRMPAA